MARKRTPMAIAHLEVRRARVDGRLPLAQACEVCGAKQENKRGAHPSGWTVVWHHWNYDLPLDVIPMCRSCHNSMHRGSVQEPRTGRWYPKQTRHPRRSFVGLPEAEKRALVRLAMRAVHSDFGAHPRTFEAACDQAGIFTTRGTCAKLWENWVAPNRADGRTLRQVSADDWAAWTAQRPGKAA